MIISASSSSIVAFSFLLLYDKLLFQACIVCKGKLCHCMQAAHYTNWTITKKVSSFTPLPPSSPLP